MKLAVVGLDIPVVKAYEGTAENMQALVDDIKTLEGAEGFVVRFDSGHMVKVKGEWYCQLHSAKDAIAFEKNVIAMLVSEKVDDVKAFLLPEDLVRVNEFEAKFWDGMAKTAHKLLELRCSVPMEMDRKTYAVEFVQKQEEKYQRFLYAMHGLTPSDNTVTLVKEAVARNVGTQTKVDECRWMFNCSWNTGATE
jgi:T4 RnlA family RNA ligase